MAQERKSKQGDEPEQLDPGTHQRLLGHINSARRGKDLALAPVDKHEGIVNPEHRRNAPYRHDRTVEERRREREQVLDPEVADEIIRYRDENHPLGFRHVREIEAVLDDRFIDILDGWITRFGPRFFGKWSDPIELEDEDGHFSVVHAAVLKDGKVLMIEHACHSGISKTPIWNPHTRALESPPTPPTEGLYCSGHCFLSDGKLLVVGGRGDANHWPNDKDIAWLYDPDTNSWDVTRDRTSLASPKPRTKMHHDRWYPTLVNLGDEPGRVLIASGDVDNLSCTPSGSPPMPMEVYSEQSGKFTLFSTPADKYHRPTYPGLHPLPGGEVFYAPVGFRSSGESTGLCAGNEDAAYLDVGWNHGTWHDIGPNDRTKGMSVLLLDSQYPYVQVMTVGGGDLATTGTHQLINLSTLSPSWDAPLSNPTVPSGTDPVSWVHPNLVLLPDGSLFVAGGTPAGDPCWLYEPRSKNWSRMDAMTYERRYHSVAVLCPTGEVMATGGKHHQAGVDTVEVFQPPYLFRGDRPSIDDVAPRPVHHGGQLTIETGDAAEVTEVVLMRPMAVTHQTDSEQRRIQLPILGRSATSLVVGAPDGRHPHAIAPRGWYMLFILEDGVPSEAEMIELH